MKIAITRRFNIDLNYSEMNYIDPLDDLTVHLS